MEYICGIAMIRHISYRMLHHSIDNGSFLNIHFENSKTYLIEEIWKIEKQIEPLLLEFEKQAFLAQLTPCMNTPKFPIEK